MFGWVRMFWKSIYGVFEIKVLVCGRKKEREIEREIEREKERQRWCLFVGVYTYMPNMNKHM